MRKKEEDMVNWAEKYYIKTRELVLSKDEADAYGIRRVYNQCSDIDYMGKEGIEMWIRGLYRKDIGEAVLVESSLKVIGGIPLYVASCIVFRTFEQCNLFYLRNQGGYGDHVSGFMHLYN